MRQILFTALLLLAVCYTQAQINALTETGDEVVLYHDGTWAYTNDSVAEGYEIKMNETAFTRDKKSSFLVKSKKLNIGVWMDPKTWTFAKGVEGEAAEFDFEKKGEDLYGMLITEKLQIPIETLKTVAIENARDAAPDIKLIQEEYRMVNGIKVLMMQMSGTIQGMRFTYYGYYYSNENGTIQLLTYTGENLLPGYLNDIETFINGLVEL